MGGLEDCAGPRDCKRFSVLEEEPDFLDFLARSEVAMDPEEAWDDGE